MFYIIPITLGVCALAVFILFIWLLALYVKKRNSQKVEFYINGKKAKTHYYNYLENLKFPKTPDGTIWYFDEQLLKKYNPDDVLEPIFKLYAQVKEEKPVEKPKEEKSVKQLTEDKPIEQPKEEKPIEQPKEDKNAVQQTTNLAQSDEPVNESTKEAIVVQKTVETTRTTQTTTTPDSVIKTTTTQTTTTIPKAPTAATKPSVQPQQPAKAQVPPKMPPKPPVPPKMPPKPPVNK